MSFVRGSAGQGTLMRCCPAMTCLQEQNNSAATWTSSLPEGSTPGWVSPVCCFQLFQQIKLLHGMMEGKMGNEKEPLPPTGITQEAQTDQGSKGPQSPGGRKFRTVRRPSDKAKWRDWLPTNGPKPGLSQAKRQPATKYITWLQTSLCDRHLIYCPACSWQPALMVCSFCRWENWGRARLGTCSRFPSWWMPESHFLCHW